MYTSSRKLRATPKTNVGTITVRQVPYYRVRITLDRDCEPNERWTFRLRPSGDARAPARDDTRYTACRKDALLTGVPPGSYNLAVWRGRGVERWAIAPVVVTKANTSATLAFTESPRVSGRVVAAEKGDLSKLGLVSTRGMAVPNDAGEFTFERVPRRSQWLSVQPIDSGTYVREIRYNGLPVRSHVLDLVPGANLEVVLDSQAAGLTVTLKRGDTIVACSGATLRSSCAAGLPRGRHA